VPPDFCDSSIKDDFVVPNQPLFNHSDIEERAKVYRDEATNRCAVGTMPTDEDLAFSVTWNLSEKSTTGEVHFPTNGYRHDGLVLTENFCGDGSSLNHWNKNSGTVTYAKNFRAMIFGNSMFSEMADLVRSMLDNPSSKAQQIEIILCVGSDEGRNTLEKLLAPIRDMPVKIIVESKMPMNDALTKCIDNFGKPDAVLSFPMGRVEIEVDADKPVWESLPRPKAFKKIVEDHVTCHFLIAQRAALIAGCKVIFITAKDREGAHDLEIEFHRFLAKSLRPLTVAVHREVNFLPQHALFFQINGNLKKANFVEILNQLFDTDSKAEILPQLRAAS
jgi:hypothetical protein